MIDYLWSKLQQNPLIFGEERAQKPSKMGHFMAAASPQNHLNSYNWRTTNAIKMKLTTIIYLHKTFRLA